MALSLIGNQTTITVGDQEILTLRDILPAASGLNILFVAKTPARESVRAGHYFQGAQGCQFWCRLKQYGLLKPTTVFEDDSLLDHGYGLTDIAKIPRDYGEEPSRAEYEKGSDRILELIRVYQPKIVVFVYKKVLDQIVRFRFGIEKKSVYGFNGWLEPHFGAQIFAFPLPGVGRCDKAQAGSAMQQLVRAYEEQAAARLHLLPQAKSTLGSPDDFLRAEQAAQFILERTSLRPRIGLVLGSGLGAVASGLMDVVRIPYEDIPYFPSSTAESHAGVLVLGTLDNIPLAVLQGRAHLYEGYSSSQIVLPVRALERMGVRALVLTNAAGGINDEYSRGALVVLRDHINLQGQNPLIGPNDERLGLRHPDMTDAYNAQFRQFVREESKRLGKGIFEGVYAAVTGPNFETPAEIRFLRTIGADLVGMSTVAEVIAARHMGMEVLAVSCVTNMAAGMTGEKITEEEVLETGERLASKLLALLRAVLPRIDGYLQGRATASD